MRAGALADNATLDAYAGATDSLEQACEALAIAREIDDPALLARALTACGGIAVYNPEVARPYFAEASGLARSTGDKWRLSQILFWQAFGAFMAGDPIAVRAAAEEGRDLADAIGDRFVSLGAAGVSVWHKGFPVIRLEPSRNCVRWLPRPTRLTTRSGGAPPYSCRPSC